mgnify:CR=1 FL=1
MNRVIGGKMYDTKTAKCVGTYSYGDPNEPEHYTESLYQKRTGEFFLYGEGGPESLYSHTIRMGVCGDWDITPYCDEGAKSWVEQNCDGDTYVKLFGEVEE